MINYKIIITEKAMNDIWDTSSYISNDLLQPLAAERLIEKFQTTIASLSQTPTRHELVKDEEISRKSIRKIFVDKYIIFYIINDFDLVVAVIRVLYSKRDWINLI